MDSDPELDPELLFRISDQAEQCQIRHITDLVQFLLQLITERNVPGISINISAVLLVLAIKENSTFAQPKLMLTNILTNY